MNYESIQCTRIRLEDNPSCNIGIHFDLVADKIGEIIIYMYVYSTLIILHYIRIKH